MYITITKLIFLVNSKIAIFLKFFIFFAAQNF